MAQTGFTPLSLYYTTTAAAAPSAVNLVNGELAINITDGKLYYKDNLGVVKVIAGAGGAGVAGGSNTQVQYNSSGNLAGSANMVFDGTTLTVNGLATTGTVTLGDASGDALTINSSAVSIPNGLNFDSNTLVIDATNNYVGIGIATPSAPLSFGVSTGQKIRFYNSVSGYGIGVESSEFRFVTDSSAIFTWGTGSYASPTERMRLTAAGDLVVGTTASVGNSQITAYGASNGQIAVQNSTNWSRLLQNAGDLYIDNGVGGTAGNIIFRSSSSTTERMRITSAGNVGIGTSSPSTLLDVRSSSDGAIGYFRRIGGTANPGITILANETGNTVGFNTVYSTSSPSYTFSIGGTERMRLDSSGNLGLGVTPSAWYSLSKAIDIGAGGTIQGRTNTAGTFELATNAYLNTSGNWTYKASSIAANNYAMSDGTFKWFTAPSGTAGNAITFTQAMTLDASGNLGIGDSSPSATLTLRKATGNTNGIHFRAAGWNSIGRLGINGTVGADLILSSNWNAASNTVDSATEATTYINVSGQSGNGIIFGTGATNTVPTERMRITTGGNLGIGTTTPDIFSRSHGRILGINSSSGNAALEINGPTGSGGMIELGTNAVRTGQINGNASGIEVASVGALPVYLSTNGLYRFSIDSSGNALFAKAVRATITTDNDLSFDMNAASNFKSTLSAGGALTFTNITSGQTGNIILVNGSNYAITAAATTKVSATCLATISATGTYWLSYYSDDTNVYVANTGALA